MLFEELEKTAEAMTTEYDRLQEISELIGELLGEAAGIAIPHDASAQPYWIAHIKIALSNEHDYLGRCGSTMQSTLEVMEAKIADLEDEAMQYRMAEELEEDPYLGCSAPGCENATYKSNMTADGRCLSCNTGGE